MLIPNMGPEVKITQTPCTGERRHPCLLDFTSCVDFFLWFVGCHSLERLWIGWNCGDPLVNVYSLRTGQSPSLKTINQRTKWAMFFTSLCAFVITRGSSPIGLLESFKYDTGDVEVHSTGVAIDPYRVDVENDQISILWHLNIKH